MAQMFDVADGISLRSGFLRSASKYPSAPALAIRGATRSYREIEETARIWAQGVHHLSSSHPQRVGLLAYRSEVSYTGSLAALLSGSAFVPLNPNFPPATIASMIDQADLQAIFVDRAGAAVLPEIRRIGVSLPPLLLPEFDSPRFDNIDVPLFGRREIQKLPALQTLPPVHPDDVAYLLFTSGTTGKPKGVPVTHHNVVYFIEVMTERYQIRPEDRFSQTFDQTFDLSVFDLFMAWSNGACVFSMTPVELLAPSGFINKNSLTIWFSVPSLPAHMLRRNTLTPGSLPTLRWSLFCGEPLPARAAEMWQAAAPGSIVENLYGPTELTIACFVHRWNAASSPAVCRNGLVPIGVPFPGLGALVVDEDLRSVRDGEVGELCVCGPQTTPGYWRDPGKTAEKFVQLPISKHEFRRFYRTGDLVARGPAGEYVFIGRTDHQAKVLGHRIELGEIEAAIRQNSGVEHVVACPWPVTNGSAAGIVCFASGNSLDERALIHLAKSLLPHYAVPSKILIVSEMPLNANGKIDRSVLQKQLPEMMSPK